MTKNMILFQNGIFHNRSEACYLFIIQKFLFLIANLRKVGRNDENYGERRPARGDTNTDHTSIS